MGIKKIHTSLDVEKIFCTVTCPFCSGQVTMKMRGPITRKSCPKCNHITYCFTVIPLRGYINVVVTTIGPDETPREYEIGPSEITIEEDEPKGDENVE